MMKTTYFFLQGVCLTASLPLLLSMLLQPSVVAQQQTQQLPTQEDLCPDYTEVDPLKKCQTIGSYAGLKRTIEQADAGASLNLCPFFVQKVSSADPIIVQKGIQVTCVRKAPDDICIINGMGTHLLIDTAENTLWQGFSFRGSNDHAVYIDGDVDDSENSVHTFCQSSFVENIRTKDTRGGSFMAEPKSGTVNVVQCLFSENFTGTYGAAIYSRTEQLNVINSIFVKNRSTGYGGAIFTASGASLMIRGTSFLSNKGRESHDVVFNPQLGTETFQDGSGNSINDGDCRGVFDLIAESCYVFVAPTPAPTKRQTAPPTDSPSTPPIQQPTRRPITKAPTKFPTRSPTKATMEPTWRPKNGRPAPSTQHSDSVPSFTLTGPTTSPSISSQSQQITQAPTRRASHPSSTHVPNPTPASDNGRQEPPSKIILSPSRQPSRNADYEEEDTVSGGIPSMCIFEPFQGDCIVIDSFREFQLEIAKGDKSVVFCGGFQVRKPGPTPVRITTDMDIRCVEPCVIFGMGPFLQIGGAMSNVRFSNMKFMMAESGSAILVSTMTSLSETTFCNVEFEGNNIRTGQHGGAINVDERSGVVNVVSTTFTDNSASKGGAIYSRAFSLNVIDSRFVANKALSVGNAIYVGEDSQITVKSSTFILNSIETIEGSDSNSQNYAIAVEPSKSIRNGFRHEAFVDAGKNRVIMSGNCSGFYNLWDLICDEFDPTLS